MTAPSVTLLPCPFCNSPARLGSREDYCGEIIAYRVDCSACFVTQKERRGKDETITAWNTRAALTPSELRERVETIAQWLHDETEHPESYPQHTWPETERDDGMREGGFVKIVPLHAQAYFRDIARRLVTFLPSEAAIRAAAFEDAAKIAETHGDNYTGTHDVDVAMIAASLDDQAADIAAAIRSAGSEK